MLCEICHLDQAEHYTIVTQGQRVAKAFCCLDCHGLLGGQLTDGDVRSVPKDVYDGTAETWKLTRLKFDEIVPKLSPPAPTIPPSEPG